MRRLMLLAVLFLTGCTTMAGIGAGGTVVDPTPEEQAYIDDLRARMSKVGVAGKLPWCRGENGEGKLFARRDCAPVVVLLDGFNKPLPRGQGTLPQGTVAIYRETGAGRHFHISRAVIQAAMAGNPAALAILAHEVAHWVNQDYGRLLSKRVTSTQVELEANTLVPWVLMRGWDMSRDDAIRAMWSMLIREAQTGRSARGAHLSACAELRDFERRLGLQAYAVDECAA